MCMKYADSAQTLTKVEEGLVPCTFTAGAELLHNHYTTKRMSVTVSTWPLLWILQL